MTATILTIGDELLIGQVNDTNAGWLARSLAELGVPVRQFLTVADDMAEIDSALSHSIRSSHVVIITGGLGPTADDITREAIAGHFSAPLRYSARAWQHVEHYFAKVDRTPPPSCERLAEVPEGFEPLSNPEGTAPGLWHEGETAIAVLPGVPREMKAIFQSQVAPRLSRYCGDGVLVHRTLCTVGLGETDIQERLRAESLGLGPDLSLAYLPRPGQVRLRLTARSAQAAKQLPEVESVLRGVLGSHVYGAGNDTLPEVVGRMLRERNMTIATAESCTGGFVAHTLTDIPGASDYVLGGIVAYANSAKECMLGITRDDLAAHGAVSSQVAQEMALAVRQRFDASVGISVTGIAGPGGGCAAKPVGTAWIGCATPEECVVKHYRFGGTRESNKIRSMVAALDLVRRALLAIRAKVFYNAAKPYDITMS